MKTLIQKDKLEEILQNLSGPTLNKQSLPILNSVLLETSKNKLKLTTTDLDTTIIAHLDVSIIKEGKVLLPFKQFFSTVRELPPKEITIELIKNNLLIKCEKIEIEVHTLNVDEFPKISVPKETLLIKVNPIDLLSIIKLTSFCVGHEDTSYVLSGILFEVEKDIIKGVSTDGRRLSFVKRKLPSNQPKIETKINFILPFRTVIEIQKVLKDKDEEIYFYVTENKIGFDLKNIQFLTRPIEGEFPPYENHIPQPQQNKMVINKQIFLAALKRAAVLATTEYQGIKLELKKNMLVIHKITPQLGKIKEEINCVYTGKQFSIGVNPYYLIDVLKNIEETDVSFEFLDVDKPVVLRTQDYIYLVMPTRV